MGDFEQQLELKKSQLLHICISTNDKRNSNLRSKANEKKVFKKRKYIKKFSYWKILTVMRHINYSNNTKKT